MYRIIGADQKEYGPVSFDVLVQWIRQGRANGQSLVQGEGSTEWKPLSAFPEFTSELGAKVPPLSPPTPPRVTEAEAEAMGRDILARDYYLDITGCISRSWNLTFANFWLVVGSAFVLSLLQGLIPLVLIGPCTGGFFFLFLKLIRGERAEFNDAFAGFTMAFLPLFLAGLVVWLLGAVALALCILPGIYLLIAWQFTWLLIIDKKMDFWPAMELSRKVISKHWWGFLGLALLNMLLMFVGFLVCIIGVHVALPITQGAIAYAYNDIFGPRPTAPTAHPPSFPT